MTKENVNLFDVKIALIENINEEYNKQVEAYEKTKENCETEDQFIERMNILGKLEGLNKALKIINDLDVSKFEG